MRIGPCLKFNMGHIGPQAKEFRYALASPMQEKVNAEADRYSGINEDSHIWKNDILYQDKLVIHLKSFDSF